MTTNCCTICGRKEHNIKDCLSLVDIYGDILPTFSCKCCRFEFTNPIKLKTHEMNCVKIDRGKNFFIEPKCD